MSNRPSLTSAQQAAAVDRIGQNIALRSGAGCGKTYVLARRFTELLLARSDADDPLAGFVALTFTEKAALEMSQRIVKLLKELADGARGPDKQKLRRWLEKIPEAKISTIHGFCASLLRQYAVEAGIDPNFSVNADELLTAQMVDESVEATLLQAVETEDVGVAILLQSISFETAAQYIAQLVQQRTDYNAADYADATVTLERWQYEATRQVEWAIDQLRNDVALQIAIRTAENATCNDATDKLAVYRKRTLEGVRKLLADPAEWTPETLDVLCQKDRGGKADVWGGKKAAQQVRQAIGNIVDILREHQQCVEPLNDADKQAATDLATLTRLAEQANETYATAKRSRGLLDFNDLMDRTARLLQDNPTVRDALVKQTDQLLVDECQDTNAFQLRMLSQLLTGNDSALPADGKLFIVGDAKQSIYRFRGAQVEVFENLCRQLGASRQENLDLCFRTHDAGVAFVNHLFAPLMGNDYQSTEAYRQDTPPHPSVEILLADNAETPIDNAADATAAEAAVLAERLVEMFEKRERLVWNAETKQWRPVQPRDVAILFRRMTQSPAYERQLARYGVPYYVVAGSEFFKQQEVYDVLNALRAVDNPYDDIALIGMLRSAMFGLNDNALAQLAESFEPPYYPKLRTGATENPKHFDGLSDEDTAAVVQAIDLLAKLHSEKDSVGIDALIDRLMEHTGYEGVLLAQFQGKRILGNVRRLTDYARRAADEKMSLADFLVQVNDLVLNQARYEQASVAGEAENVVRLMTIHKAKGLEFPVVVLPDLNAGRRASGQRLVNRVDWGLTYNVPATLDVMESNDDESETPLSFRLAAAREKAEDQREEIRLLYVAATRHQDHLIFVGADWRNKDGLLNESGCMLRQMDDILNFSAVLENDGETLPYADGRYAATVRRIPARLFGVKKRKKTLGQQWLETAKSPGELSDKLTASPAGKTAPSLIGPLDSHLGRPELAVTALSEFEHCPMLFHWRYELRVPTKELRPHGGSAIPNTSLDAATAGTLYHRCMELLDFTAPQSPETLISQAVAEMELAEAADTAGLTADLAAMLQTFTAGELYRKIAAAKTAYRELDFVMALPTAVLRGQIDLLYADTDGIWHIVDYKSDRVTPEALEAKAEHYELQMLTYAAAVARHVGNPPADATLYFLRPGSECLLEVTDKKLQILEQRIEKLAAEITQSRRTERFRRCESSWCAYCPYHELCTGRD